MNLDVSLTLSPKRTSVIPIANTLRLTDIITANSIITFGSFPLINRGRSRPANKATLFCAKILPKNDPNLSVTRPKCAKNRINFIASHTPAMACHKSIFNDIAQRHYKRGGIDYEGIHLSRDQEQAIFDHEVNVAKKWLGEQTLYKTWNLMPTKRIAITFPPSASSHNILFAERLAKELKLPLDEFFTKLTFREFYTAVLGHKYFRDFKSKYKSIFTPSKKLQQTALNHTELQLRDIVGFTFSEKMYMRQYLAAFNAVNSPTHKHAPKLDTHFQLTQSCFHFDCRAKLTLSYFKLKHKPRYAHYIVVDDNLSCGTTTNHIFDLMLKFNKDCFTIIGLDANKARIRQRAQKLLSSKDSVFHSQTVTTPSRKEKTHKLLVS